MRSKRIAAPALIYATLGLLNVASVASAQPNAREPGATRTPPAKQAKAAPKLPAPALPADALPVPLVAQAVDYSCGAASLTAVMYSWQGFAARETKRYTSASS